MTFHGQTSSRNSANIFASHHSAFNNKALQKGSAATLENRNSLRKEEV